MYLDCLEEVFQRCSEEIRVFKDAFRNEYCSDEGDLTGYLDEDGELSTERVCCIFVSTSCMF